MSNVERAHSATHFGGEWTHHKTFGLWPLTLKKSKNDFSTHYFNIERKNYTNLDRNKPTCHITKTAPGITFETRFKWSLLCDLCGRSRSRKFKTRLCKHNDSRNGDINFKLASGCVLFMNYPRAIFLLSDVRGASWHGNLKAPSII